MRHLLVLPLVLAIAWLTHAADKPEPFPPIVNSQNPKDIPPTAEEAWKKITAPEGFRVTLFAGDPDVRQPIAMALDDRGRLWVAECYTYTGQGGGKAWPDQPTRDRIVIFEDTDNDGRFDKRKIFWDEGRNLSGLTLGFGGVWALCAPNLLFIPDKDGDDIPDGPPIVKLEGWTRAAGHNIVNGLTWGPDGWLYGRHGITATSRVGPPGTAPDKRTRLNCSIWRYHPTQARFEVVTHGTTNPWGFDYDDHGQMFFTNNVIGHLWHVIPGAHFKRMYGEDFDPHLYQLIDQHADHYHWDAGKSWTDSRSSTGKHGELGGGHSHCGGMIYLGDNWPEQYRNTMFMCNTHGRRVNNDRLVRHGCGYAGKHAPDFLFANNPWFRGIDLKYGPDGGVYISDWTDIGECHDHDGVHRTSGRIYKVVYKEAQRPSIADVSKLNDLDLVKLQLHKNDWFVRQARRLLQERAAAGQDMKAVHERLLDMFHNNPDETRKLRALWALYVTGGTDEAFLRKQLEHPGEHVRVWAIRLLVDGDMKALDEKTIGELNRRARDESGLVRLFLASALQRLPLEQRWSSAVSLLGRAEDANDHNMPLMLWYAIEPIVSKQDGMLGTIVRNGRIPLVRRLLARRLAEEIKTSDWIGELMAWAKDQPVETQLDCLRGMDDALRGWRKAPAPKRWKEVYAALSKSPNKEVQELVRNLSVVFGDGRALEELQMIALRQSADGDARRAALRVLIQNKSEDLLPILQKLATDRATAGVAIEGLAQFDDAKTPALVIGRYTTLRPEERPLAINTLVTRPAYAQALLEAAAQGKIPRSDISAFHARQIQSFNNANLNATLSKVWGELRSTPDDKKKLIARYHQLLDKKTLAKADAVKGRLLYNQQCAACHRLFGEGKQVAPDLTGSNRDSLDYLLINIIDPNAIVPVDFKMSVLTMKDGRVLNGVVLRKTPQTLTLQTQAEQVTVPAGDIDEINQTGASLMPEGLFQTLKDEQVRDLVAYLMSKQQVPLPPK